MKFSAKFLKGATISVLSLACGAAYADSSEAVGFERSSLLHYSDLNLNRPQDVARLYTRIKVAADKLCGPRSLSGIHYKWTDYASCYHDTIAQTVARVDHPSLSAYFRQQSPQPVSDEISVARQ